MTEYVLRLIHAEGGSALATGKIAEIAATSALATGNYKVAAEIATAAMQGRLRVGNYLRRADVDAFDGRGDALFTPKLANAKRFATFEAAASFWKQQSKTRPYREDGEPNRPLTAFNVTIEKVLP